MFNNYLFDKHLLKACLAAVLAIGLTACSSSDNGSGTGTGMMPPEPSAPTTYEMALDNIAAADTAEAAQAAYDAVKDDVTATQGDQLQAAVNARIEALNMMAREASQKQALMDAAGMIDTSDLSTQALVDAARTAIAGLRQALADAADVSEADKAMYMSQLTTAVDAVDMAQGGIDTDTRRTNQMAALSDASDDLQAALTALSGTTPTQALLDAANNALNALNAAITGGADLTDDEKAPYQREANNAAAPISTAQMAFDDAEDEADKAKAAAMAVTASKLHAGIGTDPLTGHAVTVDATTGVWSVDPNDVAPANLANQALMADEDTMVADNYGWEGMRHTAEPEGDVGTYEAVIYSDVGEPTEGAKFNDATDGYTLDATTGETADVTTLTGHATSRVASPSFDQSAGTKEFELGENARRIVLAGSYRGVAGTYYCTPTDANTNCSATVAAMGFTLAGGTWTFKPTNPESRFMDVADAIYPSYGWWIHTSEDGDTVTVSAFAVNRGTVAAATGVTALQGKATYTGGAAGKYALHSTTGGTNDAGHFTARAMLEADFGDDMISGTIDSFMGADGQSRNWSVELMEAAITDGGAISDGATTMTKWTIGDMKGDAAGQWSGNLYENSDPGGVPQVATGTFHSTFGRDGRMVGAFGANAQ